jgi:hypothetical protein
VENELFTVILGEYNPLSTEVSDGTYKLLGIQVGADSDSGDRVPILSSASAIHSGSADTAAFAPAAPGLHGSNGTARRKPSIATGRILSEIWGDATATSLCDKPLFDLPLATQQCTLIDN